MKSFTLTFFQGSAAKDMRRGGSFNSCLITVHFWI